jgi:glutathione S-transferase
MLWKQNVLRHSHEDIIESALRDWHAVLEVMSDGPFFFGNEPTGVDAIVFGALCHVRADADQVADPRLPEVAAACVAYACARASFPNWPLYLRVRTPRRRRARRVPSERRLPSALITLDCVRASIASIESLC